MKKRLGLLIWICLCFLSACHTEKEISGEVIERSMSEDAGILSFVIQTDAGEKNGVLVTDETLILSWVDSVTSDDFRFTGRDGIVVSVSYDGSVQTMTTKNGEEIPARHAERIQIVEVQTPHTISLSDGTCVEQWQGSHSICCYKLEDGTALLWEQPSSWPDNIYVRDIETGYGLNETAKKNILSFYENQGILYDVPKELEKAYAAYKKQENKGSFSPYAVGQEISGTASSEAVLYFLTSVTLPLDGNHCTELRLGAAFDRETGEHIDGWDLFSCSEQEAKQTILDIAGITDPVLRSEIEAAFHSGCILVSPGQMEISFPQGALPSQEHAYSLGLDFDDRLCEMMHDWAVPQFSSSVNE